MFFVFLSLLFRHKSVSGDDKWHLRFATNLFISTFVRNSKQYINDTRKETEEYQDWNICCHRNHRDCGWRPVWSQQLYA